MTKGIQIVIDSPVDYEELVAYIMIGGREIGLLQQDAGQDNLRFEWLEEPVQQPIDYALLLEGLQQAKRILLQEQKLST